MSSSCDYIWTDDDPLLLEQNNFFRAVLNYSKPLQIMWTDPSCRMDAPHTHHKIYRAGTAFNMSAAAESTAIPWGIGSKCGAGTYKTVSQKPLAFNVRARVYYRRPGRDAARKALHSATSRLTKIVNESFVSANAWAAGYLVDMPSGVGDNYTTTYWSEGDWPDYCELLSNSIFTLVPGGDDYWDTRYLEAIMASSIPVVYSGAAYKQCESPADANFRSVGAPFMYVDSWDDFPRQLRDALALGADVLQEWQDNVTMWYSSYAVTIHSEIVRTQAEHVARSQNSDAATTICHDVAYTPERTAEIAVQKTNYAAKLQTALATRSGSAFAALMASKSGANATATSASYDDDPATGQICGSNLYDRCDGENHPSCTCRFGDDGDYYGGDTWCGFGECFSSECAVAQVQDFNCVWTSGGVDDDADDTADDALAR